jgi:hypothetical protein
MVTPKRHGLDKPVSETLDHLNFEPDWAGLGFPDASSRIAAMLRTVRKSPTGSYSDCHDSTIRQVLGIYTTNSLGAPPK